jgi:hypothetical protein
MTNYRDEVRGSVMAARNEQFIEVRGKPASASMVPTLTIFRLSGFEPTAEQIASDGQRLADWLREHLPDDGAQCVAERLVERLAERIVVGTPKEVA